MQIYLGINSSPYKNVFFFLIPGWHLFSLKIYAMLLGRKGEEQRALAASAVSQLSSAQNNKYAKAVYLEVHVLNLCEGNNWVLWWGRDVLLQIGWLQKVFVRNWHLLGELKADTLDSQVKTPRKKFADMGNSIAALWRWGQGIRGWILWGLSEPWEGIWILFWMSWGTSGRFTLESDTSQCT